MNSKKGVSPIIATILLIALVILIGMIVFLWFRSLTQEAVIKFDKNVKLVCEDVRFDASYSDIEGILYISNLGNVPIYNFDAKIESRGGHETQSMESLSGQWSAEGLSQGSIFSGNINIPVDTNKIILIPVLRGVNKDGVEKTQSCDERHGEEIQL